LIDFENIINSFFSFIKKWFNTLTFSILRPRKLYLLVGNQQYPEILREHVYFILTFCFFNFYSPNTYFWSNNESVIIQWIQAFFTNLFADNFFEKILFNIPGIVICYLVISIIALLAKANYKRLRNFLLFVFPSFLIIEYVFNYLLGIAFILTSKITGSYPKAIPFESSFYNSVYQYEISTIASFDEYGFLILGTLLFLAFLILMTRKARRREAKANIFILVSILIIKAVLSFVNRAEADMLYKEGYFDNISVIGEGGTRKEIVFRKSEFDDSTSLISARLLLKNNTKKDIILLRDSTIVLTESCFSSDFMIPVFVIPLKDTLNKEHFVFLESKQSEELNVIAFLSSSEERVFDSLYKNHCLRPHMMYVSENGQKKEVFSLDASLNVEHLGKY
jgi:hypothetical protein